jgi:hypothetical protein
MTTMTVRALAFASVVAAMLASPADAAQRHRRGHSETGPLIMSGTMVPAYSARRSRAPDFCKPVTVKRRPLAAVWFAR